MNEAFELRREDDVHQNDRQQKRPEKFVKGGFQFPRAAGDARRVTGRQAHLLHFGAQGGDAVGLGVTGRDRGAQADLPLPVEPVNARGGLRRHELHDIVEAREAAVLARHEQPRDGGRVVAIVRLQSHLHVVILVHGFVAEARDAIVAADHDAQRAGDVLGIHAQIGGALAVDLDAQLRLVELERGIGVLQSQLRRFLAQLLGILEQHVEVRPEQREINVEVRAAADEGLRIAHLPRAGRGTFCRRWRTSCWMSRWL